MKRIDQIGEFIFTDHDHNPPANRDVIWMRDIKRAAIRQVNLEGPKPIRRQLAQPSQLKARTGAVLDKAKRSPVYVDRDGTLLVITKARLVPMKEDSLLSPWELRAKAIESFYDSAKTW